MAPVLRTATEAERERVKRMKSVKTLIWSHVTVVKDIERKKGSIVARKIVNFLEETIRKNKIQIVLPMDINNVTVSKEDLVKMNEIINQGTTDPREVKQEEGSPSVAVRSAKEEIEEEEEERAATSNNPIKEEIMTDSEDQREFSPPMPIAREYENGELEMQQLLAQPVPEQYEELEQTDSEDQSEFSPPMPIERKHQQNEEKMQELLAQPVPELYEELEQEFEELAQEKENNPLQMLMTLYENQMRRSLPAAKIAQQEEQIVRMVQRVLDHESMEVLFVQEAVCLNTLINCVINTKLDILISQLLSISTPLHIRNYLEMTPVETCVVTKSFHWLEEIIKHGGTYHHILETRPYFGGEDHDEMRKFIANCTHAKAYSETERTTLFETVNAMNTRIDAALKDVRNSMTGRLIREVGYGPIVLFPRGQMIEAISRQTIQFRIPDDWEKAANSKFMLIVTPMAFNKDSDKFVASSLAPILRGDPLLCGVPCPPADPTQGTIYFKANNALKAHYEKVSSGQKTSEVFRPYREYPNLKARHEMVQRRISVEFHPRVCTITLDIDPIHFYSFVACQLIRFEIKRPA